MIVDNEIDNTLDGTIKELDNSYFKIVLNCIDLLFNKFQN